MLGAVLRYLECEVRCVHDRLLLSLHFVTENKGIAAAGLGCELLQPERAIRKMEEP